MPSNGKKKTSSGLRLKDGPYLTKKVERIMIQIARGSPLRRIAELYGVREPFVCYVARKTGFNLSHLNHGDVPVSSDGDDSDEEIEELPDEDVAALSNDDD